MSSTRLTTVSRTTARPPAPRARQPLPVLAAAYCTGRWSRSPTRRLCLRRRPRAQRPYFDAIEANTNHVSIASRAPRVLLWHTGRSGEKQRCGQQDGRTRKCRVDTVTVEGTVVAPGTVRASQLWGKRSEEGYLRLSTSCPIRRWFCRGVPDPKVVLSLIYT